MDFDTALKHIFVSEGGLINHPKDPGGITKYGISLRAYPNLSELYIRNMTKQQASVIYYDDYWLPMHCEELPEHLRLMVFDCAVNQGVSFATRCLQTVLSVQVDGIIGPQTLIAASTKDVDTTLHLFAINRFSRYLRNKNWATFGEGWTSRLLSVCLATKG